MTQPIDREGRFRGTIQDYGISSSSKSDSKSVGLFLEFLIEEFWNEGEMEWEDWRVYEYTASGYKYIVGRDGQVSAKVCNEVIEATGWDGNIRSIAELRCELMPCQFTVKAEEYNDEVRYKLAFLYPYDSSGKASQRIDSDGLKQLETQYGAQLRALAASKKRNAKPAASGKPAAPPPPPKPHPVAAAANPDADIPF